MAISELELTQILRNSFPEADINIVDLAGDQDHYSLDIRDNCFKGMTLIKQHKMVKEALSEVLQAKLHAITIKTGVK